MGKKKGKGKKKKNKGPAKDPKITVAEYLLDCNTQKKLRLMDNAEEWEDDNRELKTQVGSLRSELDASIAYLRRQEGTERRLCEEEVAARDGELGEAEAQLRDEQRTFERAEFELSQELLEVMVEAADTEEQVSFWKNYPFNQNLEKREKIKLLKSGIQQIDELHDAFEAQLDGNFRYMQGYLVSGQVRRLERAKRSATGWALRRVSLSDHSDLAAQPALCLQSVINHQQGDAVRDQLDWIDGQNASLQRSLAPLRRLETPPPESVPSASHSSALCSAPAAGPVPSASHSAALCSGPVAVGGGSLHPSASHDSELCSDPAGGSVPSVSRSSTVCSEPPGGLVPSASHSSAPCSEPATGGGGGGGPLRLHVENIVHLLTSARPSSAEGALLDRVRDTTLERLRPDEDEQRARALAKLVRPAASALGGSDGSVTESGSGSDGSRLSADQLLPFETPIQVPASVRRQALQPFEQWSRRRHWWRVQAPRPRARRWPVTAPHLALYVDQPPVFDLAGPKVINESPSVSSAHISDEWELSKDGWLEHLRRRSVLSVDSSAAGLATSAGSRRSTAGTSADVRGSGRATPSRGTSAAADRHSGGKPAKGSSSGSVEAKSKGMQASSSDKLAGASSAKSVTKRASSKMITETA